MEDSATATVFRGDCRAQTLEPALPELQGAFREGCIRRILVPTDFSRASARALERATALANQCDATLTILHVIDINGQAQSGTCQELMKRLWKEGSAHMAQLAWSLSGHVRAQTQVQEGHPWEVIVEKAPGFDLLILGRPRTKPAPRLFSHHTAQRVIEHAACPVMVVHDQD